MSPHKLIALDEDDLAVISAHVQSASVVASDIIWRQSEKRLVVGMRRPDCEEILAGQDCPHQVISALRFDRVLACKARNIDMAKPQEALILIGLEFHPTDRPGGNVLLLFANGGVLRLDVECLECELADLACDVLGDALGETSGEDRPARDDFSDRTGL